MEARVRTQVAELNEIRMGSKVGNMDQYFAILISEVNDKDKSTSQLESVCAESFDKNKGVLRILDLRYMPRGGREPGRDDLINGFLFVEHVLRQMEQHDILHLLPPHVAKTSTGVECSCVSCVCLYTVRHNQDAIVRGKAFEPLVTVCSKAKGRLVASEDVAQTICQGLLEEYSQGTSASPSRTATWQANFFRLLGKICANYKKMVSTTPFRRASRRGLDSADQDTKEMLWKAVLNRVLKVLKDRRGSGDVSGLVVASCFEAMNSIFVSFTEEISEEDLRTTYTAVMETMAVSAGDTVESRYNKPRMSLSLLANHSKVFSRFFHNTPEFPSTMVFDNLLVCCGHKNLSNDALKAIESFLGCLHLGLDQEHTVFKELLNKFSVMFKKSEDWDSHSPVDVMVAIRGFGALAPLVKDDRKRREWFVQCGGYLERLMNSREGGYEMAHELPDIVNALADILNGADNLASLIANDEGAADVLDKTFCSLYENYVKAGSARRFLYERAWFNLMFALYKGNALDAMLMRAMLGLVATTIQPSSDELACPPGLMPVGSEKPQPCVRYAGMWKSVSTGMQAGWLQIRGREGCTAEVQREIAAMLHRHLIESVIEILDRLDLQLTDPDEAAEESAPTGEENAPPSQTMFVSQASGMSGRERPSNQRDFDMFLNLVLFFERVMTASVDADFLAHTYYSLCKTLVRGSTKHPLISGYFKILTSCMRIVEKGGFLAKSARGLPGRDVEMTKASSEAELCSSLISKFAREVVGRSDKVFDDLLASCLGFVLSLPKQIREFDVQVPALQAALKLGVDSPEMARCALGTLESWVRFDLPSVRKYFSAVLPLLNDLLILPMSMEDGSSRYKLESVEVANRRAAAQSARESKRRKYRNADESEETLDAKQIAIRTMKLLGKLGSESGLLVQDGAVQGSEDKEFAGLDTSMRLLQVDVTGPGTGEELYVLDPVLPRIVHLAERSVDRKLRVVACECLHALIMLAVGKHNELAGQRSNEERSTDFANFDSLFRFLFPVVIRLAVSLESVASQMFEPLAKQLVHWFTSARGGEEADVLLDAVLQCLESSSDGKVREGASKLLSEYVVWTLRGLTTTVLREDAVRPRMLLLRLYGLMNHPSVSKRIGAYLAVRELGSNPQGLVQHVDVVDQFLLELMHNLILSLKFVDRDDPVLEMPKIALGALTALEKVLDQHRTILKDNRVSTKNHVKHPRRLHQNLACFVEWLFEMTGAHEKTCRRYCQTLFSKLCGLLSVPKTWIRTEMLDRDDGWLVKIFEADLADFPTTMCNIDVELARMRPLVTAMDAYEWLLRVAYVRTADAFCPKSKVLKCVEDFVLKATQVQPMLEQVTPRDAVRYQHGKSNCIYAMLKLFCTLLDTYPDDDVVKKLVSDLLPGMMEMVFLALLVPRSLDLDVVGDPVVFEVIPKQIDKLLRAVIAKHVGLTDTVKTFLLDFLTRGKSGKSKLSLNLQDIDVKETDLSSDELCVLFAGYQRLGVLDLIPPQCCNGMAEKLLKQVWMMVFGDLVGFDGSAEGEDMDKPKQELSPAQRAVAEKMIPLSFFFAKSLHRLWPLFDNGQKSRGWTFYLSFRDCLLDCISANIADDDDDVFFSKASDSPARTDVLLSLLDRHISLLARDVTTKPELQAENVVCVLLKSKAVEGLVSVARKSDNQHRLRQAIDLLLKILRLQNILSNSSRLRTAFYNVRYGMIGAFCSCLQALVAVSTEVALKNIVFAFRALPLMLDQLSECEAVGLLDNVRKVLAKHAHPLSSPGDFEEGSARYQSYSTVFSALLFAVSESKTAVVLPLLFDAVINKKNVVFEKEIAEALDTYVLGLAEDKQVDFLQTLIADVLSSASSKEVDLELQRAKVEMLALRIVQRLGSSNNEASLVTVFGSHSKQFVETLGLRAEGDEVLLTLNRKICVMNLVQAMFRHISYEKIKTEVSSMFSGQEPLTKRLIDDFRKARSMDGPSQSPSQPGWWRADDNLRRLVYMYHRTLQNTFSAVMSRWLGDQTKDKTCQARYSLLITGLPWDNIVDKEAKHKFGVQVRFKESYDYLTAFRQKQTAAAQAKGRDHADLHRLVYETARSMSSVLPSLSTFSSYKTGPTLMSVVDLPEDGSHIVLQDDSGDEGEGFNKNECMRPLLALLDRMRLQFPSPDMPEWMKALRDKLRSTQEEDNVRMFIAKLIINNSKRLVAADRDNPRDQFKPFALEFFESFFHKDDGLVYVVTAEKRFVGETNDTANAFNFFLRDICRLWMEWMRKEPGAKVFAFSSEEQVTMAWKFIYRMMSILMHDDKQVVSSNVTFFEYFFREWRIPGEDIGEHLTNCMDRTQRMLRQFKNAVSSEKSDSEKRKALLNTQAGLNILLAVTRIELEYLRQEATASQIIRITADKLQGCFKACLAMLCPPKDAHDSVVRPTLRPAAAACAQVLACAAYEVKTAAAGQRMVMEKSEVEKNTRDLTAQLVKLEKESRDSPQRLLEVIEQIVICFECYAMEDICFRIVREWYRKLPAGPSLTILQQVLLRRLKCIWKREDQAQRLVEGRAFATEIQQLLIYSLQKCLDDKVQLLTLQTLTGRRYNGALLDEKGQVVDVHKSASGLLMFMDVDDVRSVLVDTGVATQLARHANKVCRLHFFLLLKDIYDLPHLGSLFVEQEMHRFFVPALNDGDEEVRDLAFQWWDTILPKDYGDRLLQMLQKMVSPSGNDSSWLCNASMLLLSVARHTNEPKAHFFKQPLQQNATFSEKIIETSVRAGSLQMMTPMFSSSLSTSSSLSQSLWLGSQTQGTGGGGVLATLVQDTSTDMDIDKSADDFLAAQTLQAGTAVGGTRAVNRAKGVGPSVAGATSKAPVRRGGAFAAPKDRFARRPKDVADKERGLMMARREEDKKLAEKRTKEARKNQVFLKRKYRVGEVPDIQSVTKDDLLNTLQKVVQSDSASARKVLSPLYDSVVKSSTAVDGVQDKTPLRISIEGMLLRMLGGKDASAGSSADLAEALLDVAHTADIALNASIVAQACSHPQVCALFQGIRALERQSKRVIPDVSNPDVSKVLSRKRSHQSSDGSKSAAKRRAEDAMADDDLVQLARLYEKLQENDIALGQCEQVCRLPQTREALSNELLGDYHDAARLYLELCNRGDDIDWGEVQPTKLEEQQWDTGYINCVRGLLGWSKLKESVEENFEGSLDAIWDLEHRPSLHHYMRALVGLSPEEMEEVPGLVAWVDDCWGNDTLANRRQVLESEFGVETALALLLDKFKDTAMARELVKREMDRFLAGWSEGIGLVAKRDKLRKLQRIIELDEYINVVVDKRDGAHDLIKAWSERIPSRGDDDKDSWDFVLSSRIALTKRLKDVCPVSDEVQRDIDASIAKLNLSMSKVARSQGSLAVAELYLNNAKALGGSDLHYCRGKVKLIIAESAKSHSPEAKVLQLRDADKMLRENQSLLQDTSKRESAKYLSLWSQLQGNILHNVWQADAGGITVEGVTNRFSRALQLAEADASCTDLAPTILLKLALFCDKTAARTTAMPVGGSNIVWMYIDSMLRAMALGATKAQEHFPRVLELLETHFSALRGDQVTKLLTDVPPWMLLEWLPQIFSLVARNPPVPFQHCLIACLGRVAALFPQAAYYAFRVVRDDIAKDPKRSAQIYALLGDYHATERLCRALQLLQHPDAQITNFFENILAPTVRDRTTTKQMPLITTELEVAYRELYEDCLDLGNKAMGQYRKETARQFARCKIWQDLGKEGQLSQAIDAKTAKKILEDWGQWKKDSKFTPKEKRTMPLAHFTNALESCDADGATLRIPGVEMGGSEAALAAGEAGFVSLVSCDPTLKVMTSIQKPKRLKMRGGNGQEYWWLVKGGEDLRQDQRVQQVFRSMNRILANDTQCAKRRLNVEVFKVVPISKVFGIIEWVRDSDTTLGQMIGNGVMRLPKKNQDQKHSQILEDMMAQCAENVKGKKPTAEDYSDMIENANSSQFAEKMKRFVKIQEMLPLTTLRDGLMSKAQTAQLEFQVRKNFALSLSASSCCQYILGIGDRHVENILVNDRNGKILAIDFGHAFGSATQLLPIQELMPFRLTRQMVGVLAPLEPHGLLKRSMTYVMSALRANHDVLRRTLEIFASDPTVDWLKYANRPSAPKVGGITQWIAATKIEALDQKLEGMHPSEVMRNELLKCTHEKPRKAAQDMRSGLNRVVCGESGSLRRKLLEESASRTKPYILNPKEQVDVLVEQATDPAVLCCTYRGWSPWL